MKKSLLLLFGAALLGNAASAQAPTIYDSVAINKISPNGTWAFSEDYWGPGFTILNLETGEQFGPYLFSQPDGSYFCYEGGLGNSISNTGIVLANTDPINMDAAYWENGEWKQLPLLEDTPSLGNNALGITPDGSRICGTLCNPYTNYAIGNTCIPCIWNRKDDGSYDTPIPLPYPELDVTGRIPSLTRVAYISADGKTLFGQMVDYSGFLAYPIIYHENADGSWSYELLHYNDLFLADSHNITPCPSEDDIPADIDPADFMSEEYAAKYRQEYQEFMDGTGEWPDPAEFMTAAQAEEYNKAVDEYNNAAEEWNNLFYAFQDSFISYCNSIPNLVFNSYCMSDNAKYALAGGKEYDYLFNLETGEYKMIEDYDVKGIQVTGDGTVLGYTPIDIEGYTRNAFILPSGSDAYIPFEEYIEGVHAPIAEWINENFVREMPVYKWDEATGSILIDADGWLVVDHTNPKVVTGQPCATEDLSVFALWTYDSWTQKTWDHIYFSSVFDIEAIKSGINDIKTETSNAAAVYYNLQGVKVPAENLPAGIYVKVQGENAEKVFVK